jgi:hypothetical protein
MPEGKRPLGKPRRAWADNIKMYIRETVCGGIDYLYLSQDRDQGSCDHCDEPSCSITCWEVLE